MTHGFGGFYGSGGSAEHIALFSIVLRNAGSRGDRDGFGGFGGFGRDGYPPLNSTTLFRHPERGGVSGLGGGCLRSNFGCLRSNFGGHFFMSMCCFRT